MYLRHQAYTLYYRHVCILIFLRVFAHSMLLRCMLKFKCLACGSEDVTQYKSFLGRLPSVEVACEKGCCCMQKSWFPQTLLLTTRQPGRCLYKYCSNSNSLLEVPDILSCQAEAKRLALTLIKCVFADRWCTNLYLQKASD